MINDQFYTEKELIKLASGGDENAFTQLFLLHKDRLYCFTLHLTESSELAQDLVQDVFFKLWKDHSHLKQVENFGGYIFKLAQNQAINAFKRKTNEMRILSKIQKQADICGASPVENMDCKDVQNLVNDILKKLPPQQKIIFKLSREYGLKHEEIAHQLKISPSTVKNHLILALHTIRQYLRSNLDIADFCILVMLLCHF